MKSFKENLVNIHPRKTWLDDDKAFKCWVCQNYPSSANDSNCLKTDTDI